MPKDFYQSGEDTSASADTANEGDAKDDANEGGDESEAQTTLIPKSMFPDEKQVGDECTFKIVHAYEDEYEVEYAKDDSENKSPGMKAADAAMDKMANRGDEMPA